MADRITMTHPALPGRERQVTQAAFDATWSARGWEKSEDVHDGEEGDDRPVVTADPPTEPHPGDEGPAPADPDPQAVAANARAMLATATGSSDTEANA